jgi:hypothetical protein
MKCGYCGGALELPAKVCPHCGQDPGSGVYQTSAVLIGAGKRHSVYPSVAELPPRLRTRLMKSTSGPNAGTIIIADRRGREEISKALRHKPGNPEKAPVLRVPRTLVIALLAIIVILALAAIFVR